MLELGFAVSSVGATDPEGRLRRAWAEGRIAAVSMAIWLGVTLASASAAGGGASWTPAAEVAFAQAGGSERSRSVALGVAWALPWQAPWWGGRIASYAELSGEHWASVGPSRPIDPTSFTRVGVTPVARWYPAADEGRWFAEIGIGLHLMSPVYRVGGRQFSSSFNFGDHLALGRAFGEGGRHEWSVRLQHFSNGGLREPNPGEDFVQVRYARRF
jgi:lipid A 3-O-deacylase